MSVTITSQSTTGGEESYPIPGPFLDIEPEQIPATCIPTQHPISVTLDGTALFVTASALILIIHFAEPRLAQVLIAIVPLLLLIRNDYYNFLGLGPGGTPSTFKGYITITWLRLWALRDPFTAPKSDPNRRPNRGVLQQHAIPFRPGPRPLVAGIAPQRQLDQHGTILHYKALRRTLKNLSITHPQIFGTARSCLEKHGLALFARHPINVTCNGEICHIHDSDHSLHMNLHPEDIKEVLEKGWAQRHPLAFKSWFGSMPVPEHFVMIYAPRDDLELRIVCKIIEAAIWYVLSEQVDIEVMIKS